MKIIKKTKVAIILIALSATSLIFAQITHEGTPATNCKYTGNSADYCYASNGQQNLKIINCKPGTTSCYY